MANWNTGATASKFDADTYTNKAKSARKYSFNSGINGLDGGQVDVLFGIKKLGYDVVGINAKKVKTDLIPAFEEYLKGINGKINDINTTAKKIKAAFRGTELENSVSKYVAKMEKFLKDYTSQLRSFEDKLIDVSKAWDSAQSKQAASVNKTASSFSGIGEYKRKLQ